MSLLILFGLAILVFAIFDSSALSNQHDYGVGDKSECEPQKPIKRLPMTRVKRKSIDNTLFRLQLKTEFGVIVSHTPMQSRSLFADVGFYSVRKKKYIPYTRKKPPVEMNYDDLDHGTYGLD